LEVSQTLIAVEDVAGPGDGVSRTDTRWLRPNPWLKVLGTIVVAHPVDVVHGLVGEQMTTEHCFHHEDVLEDVPPGARSSPWMIWHPNHDVSPFEIPPCVDRASTWRT
jgi:hypothetical protein